MITPPVKSYLPEGLDAFFEQMKVRVRVELSWPHQERVRVPELLASSKSSDQLKILKDVRRLEKINFCFQWTIKPDQRTTDEISLTLFDCTKDNRRTEGDAPRPEQTRRAGAYQSEIVDDLVVTSDNRDLKQIMITLARDMVSTLAISSVSLSSLVINLEIMEVR